MHENRPKMHRSPLALAPLVALLLVALAGVPTAAQSQGATVAIQSFSFAPGTLTVPVGAQVTWVNQTQLPQSAVADTGAFDTGAIAPGKSKTITLSQAGTFSYYSVYTSYIRGTITVGSGGQPAAQPVTAPVPTSAPQAAPYPQVAPAPQVAPVAYPYYPAPAPRFYYFDPRYCGDGALYIENGINYCANSGVRVYPVFPDYGYGFPYGGYPYGYRP